VLFNFASVKDNTSAAHSQYINNIEACGSFNPLSAVTGSQPASLGPPPGSFGPPPGSFNPQTGSFGPPPGNFGPQPGIFGPQPAAVGSLLDTYFSQVRDGTVTPHVSVLCTILH